MSQITMYHQSGKVEKWVLDGVTQWMENDLSQAGWKGIYVSGWVTDSKAKAEHAAKVFGIIIKDDRMQVGNRVRDRLPWLSEITTNPTEITEETVDAEGLINLLHRNGGSYNYDAGLMGHRYMASIHYAVTDSGLHKLEGNVHKEWAENSISDIKYDEPTNREQLEELGVIIEDIKAMVVKSRHHCTFDDTDEERITIYSIPSDIDYDSIRNARRERLPSVNLSLVRVLAELMNGVE